MKLPTAEEFKERARKVYEEQRDQERELAVITIAHALMTNWSAGAEAAIDDQLARLTLMSADVDKQRQPF